MKISSRLSVAIHILALLDLTPIEVPTSAYIAESVNTNPVVIRRILGLLKAVGLVEVKRGSGGAFLLKSSEEITLLDIYKAVGRDADGDLFSRPSEANQTCPIGAHIRSVIDPALDHAQWAMETELMKVSLFDLTQQLDKTIHKESI